MNRQKFSHIPKRHRAPASPAFARFVRCLPLVAGALVWLSVPARAQNTVDRTDKTDKSDTYNKSDRSKNPSAPARELPPTNPLVLLNPQDGSGNNTALYDRAGLRKRDTTRPRADYGDYTTRPDDPRVGKAGQTLPVYGFSFFEWARRSIEARRAAYLRLNGGDPNQFMAGRAPVNPSRANANFGDRSPSPINPLTANNRDAKALADLSGNNAGNPNNNGDANPANNGGDDTNGRDANSDTANAGTMNGSRARPPQEPDTDMTGQQTVPGQDDAEGNDAASLAERQRRERILLGLGGTAASTAKRPTAPPDNTRDATSRAAQTRINQERADNSRGAANDADAARFTRSNDPVDAFRDIADPISTLYRNVLASVPTTYQLSIGDRVTIRYSSPTMPAREYAVTVDRQGTLNIEGMARVAVLGKTLAQAEADIRTRLRRLYNNPDVSLSLTEARTISVTVGGEAFAPGSYTIPAIAGAFSLLYAAGGPTEDGSLRRIEIRRAGRLVGTLDFYKFLITGDQGDVALQSGDLIYIPASQARVAVRGEVRRPALFELTDGETLQDALRYAGGVKASGVVQNAQVSTIVPGAARVLKNVDIKDKPQVARFPLYDGDAVDIFSLRPTITNKVTVEGAVDQPSDYALTPGMRVSDLIALARGTLPEAYLARAELYHWKTDNTTALVPIDLEKALNGDPTANLALTRWDRLKIYTRQEVAWAGSRKITVRGPVQKPGVYELSENMRVSDLLLKIGGPMPEAWLPRAVLQHQDGDGRYRMEYVNLYAVSHGDHANDPVLQDNDTLAVYRYDQDHFDPDHTITVLGSVTTPGLYPRGEGMRLDELIQNAGGFRPGAAPTVSVAHARKPIDGPDAKVKMVVASFDSRGRCAPGDNVQMEDGDVVTVQGTGGFIDRVQTITVSGAVGRPGPIILNSKQMRLSDALRAAGGLRPEAYPSGAEFFRDASMMTSPSQRDIAVIVGQLSDLINDSSYKRELAKSDLERIKAAGAASASSSALAIPGAGGGAAANPAAAELVNQLSQHDLVSRPRTLNAKELVPNGNIAVDLTEALRHPGGNDDILLQDGDVVRVPEQPTTVQVVGAVVNGRGVLYRPNANLDYYVSQSGGFAPDAAKDKIVVIHAGGGLIPANKVRNLQPGDVIVVPTKVLAEKLSSNQNGFDSIFRSVTNSAIIFRLATGLFGL